MKRLTAAFNGLAEQVEAITAEAHARRLGNEPAEEPKHVEVLPANGRRKPVAAS